MSASKVAIAKAERRFLQAQAAEDAAWESGDDRKRVRATEARFSAELDLARLRNPSEVVA